MKNIILFAISLIAFSSFNSFGSMFDTEIPEGKLQKYLDLKCSKVLSGEQVDDNFTEYLFNYMKTDLELKDCDKISEAEFSRLVDSEMIGFYSKN
jgi:hypothetical protein